MKLVMILLLALGLTACGSNGDSGGTTNTPIPLPGSISASLVDYVNMFKDRYNVAVNYSVIFDTEGETGGQGNSGTTVGVCRIWSSGRREILVNQNWWQSQQKVAKSQSVTNGLFGGNNYTYNFGSLGERRNGEMNFEIENTGNTVTTTQISSDNTDFAIKSKTCTSNNKCTVVVSFNLSENKDPGSYSGNLLFGSKTITMNVTVVAQQPVMDTGEVNRKILIYHELGHCSFNRNHDSTLGDGVNYPSNMPMSMMYPTINNIATYYNAGYDEYYEDELIGNAPSVYQMNYQALSLEEEGEDTHDHSTHSHGSGDCVQYMD